MTIGYFIVNKNYLDYLNYTIPSIINNISPNRLNVLGDLTNISLSSKFNCDHYIFDNYNYGIENMTKKIKSCFINSFPVALDYETFCYLRWIYIRNFMVAHNYDQCVYFDSDVLLFDNIKNIVDNLTINENTYFNLSSCKMIHMPCLTIISLKILNLFIDFMDHIFSLNKDFHYKWIKYNHFITKQLFSLDSTCNEVNDMTLFGCFFANHEKTWFDPFYKYDLNNIIHFDIEQLGKELGYYINSNINDILNKNEFPLFIKNNNYYYYDGLKIFLLHFQGNAKKYIKSIYENDLLKLDFLILNI